MGGSGVGLVLLGSSLHGCTCSLDTLCLSALPPMLGLPTASHCREQYAEMREEFYAGLEDRKYLPLPDAQKKGLQVWREEFEGWREAGRRQQGGERPAAVWCALVACLRHLKPYHCRWTGPHLPTRRCGQRCWAPRCGRTTLLRSCCRTSTGEPCLGWLVATGQRRAAAAAAALL